MAEIATADIAEKQKAYQEGLRSFIAAQGQPQSFLEHPATRMIPIVGPILNAFGAVAQHQRIQDAAVKSAYFNTAVQSGDLTPDHPATQGIPLPIVQAGLLEAQKVRATPSYQGRQLFQEAMPSWQGQIQGPYEDIAPGATYSPQLQRETSQQHLENFKAFAQANPEVFGALESPDTGRLAIAAAGSRRVLAEMDKAGIGVPQGGQPAGASQPAQPAQPPQAVPSPPQPAPAPTQPIPGQTPARPLQTTQPLPAGQMNPDLADKMQQFQDRAAQAGIPVRITSTLRTAEKQSQLYAQGRTAPGPIVTNAPPGTSRHETGQAFDVVPLDANGHPDYKSPNWTRLGQIGKDLGLVWGGDWKTFKDQPHFQLPGSTPPRTAGGAPLPPVAQTPQAQAQASPQPSLPPGIAPLGQFNPQGPFPAGKKSFGIGPSGTATMQVEMMTPQEGALAYLQHHTGENPDNWQVALQDVNRKGVAIPEADLNSMSKRLALRSIVPYYGEALRQGLSPFKAGQQALTKAAGTFGVEVTDNMRAALNDPAQVAAAVTSAQRAATLSQDIGPLGDTLRQKETQEKIITAGGSEKARLDVWDNTPFGATEAGTRLANELYIGDKTLTPKQYRERYGNNTLTPALLEEQANVDLSMKLVNTLEQLYLNTNPKVGSAMAARLGGDFKQLFARSGAFDNVQNYDQARDAFLKVLAGVTPGTGTRINAPMLEAWKNYFPDAGTLKKEGMGRFQFLRETLALHLNTLKDTMRRQGMVAPATSTSSTPLVDKLLEEDKKRRGVQ